MKVVTRFSFDEGQLRTIRAAHGRGGVATRKECQTFIDRAVRAALDEAPDPRPKRRPKPKPEPKAPLPEKDPTAERKRIGRLYRTEPQAL